MKATKTQRKRSATIGMWAIGFVAILLTASYANAVPIDVTFSGSIAPTDGRTCEDISDPSHLCGAFSGFFSIDPDEVSLRPGEFNGIQLSSVTFSFDSSLSISGVTVIDSANPGVGGHIFDDDDFGSGISDRFSFNFGVPVGTTTAVFRLHWLFPITAWQSLDDISGFRSTLLALDSVTTDTIATCQGCDGSFRLFAGDFAFQTNAQSVPEPGTLALLGIGLLGMGAARRRKKA